jgi:hypothetical protein
VTEFGLFGEAPSPLPWGEVGWMREAEQPGEGMIRRKFRSNTDNV